MTPQPMIAAGTPVKTATTRPTRKVLASTLAVPVAEILVWLLNTYVFQANPMPPEIATAFKAAIVLAAGYFTPPSSVDDLVPA